MTLTRARTALTPTPARECGLALALTVTLLVTVAAHFAALPAPTIRVTPLLPQQPGWGPAAHAVSPAPPPAGMAVDFRSYPSGADVEAFCRQLAAAYPHLVRVTEIGRSYQDRPILCLRLAGGEGDPDSRPALQMDGQHHAREPIGQVAVLYTAWHLVSCYGHDPLATHLLDTRTVYVVPMVNPDGNELFLNQFWGQRKNARPTDDDGDGMLDEDPAEGVFGWSVYQVYEVRFSRQWIARYPVIPFVAGWLGASRRTLLGFFDETAGAFIPQLDNDGDGKINEDPPGGVDLNRNYPIGWDNCSDQPASQIYRGAAPWSEPETRAIRDLFESLPNIRLAISYHSGDDRLAVPGIPGDSLTADEAFLERVGIKASELTEAHGYRGTRHQHGSPRADGETRAWLYELGVIPWLVEAYVGGDIAKWRWVDQAEGRAWAYYQTGLRFNPPPEGILDVCRRWLPYNLYTLALVPCPRPGQPSYEQATGILRIPVFNDGLVPVAVDARACVGEVPLGGAGVGELSAAGCVVSWKIDPQRHRDAAEALSAGATLRLELVAGGPSRQHPAPPLVGLWEWDLISRPASPSPPPHSQSVTTAFGPPRVLAGSPPGRFVDLGQAFGPGGWDADPWRWDTAYYHLGRFVRAVKQDVP